MFPGTSGPHQGLPAAYVTETTGIPWVVVVLCSSSDNSAATYAALASDIDTNGAMELLDIQDVRTSWAEASKWNASEG